MIQARGNALGGGALGPTNKTLSLSPDVNDPGFREVDFDSCTPSISSRSMRWLKAGSISS